MDYLTCGVFGLSVAMVSWHSVAKSSGHHWLAPAFHSKKCYLLYIPLLLFACSKPPQTTAPRECSALHFPGSFVGGCLDTNLDGLCSIAGDIRLTSDGFFTKFDGEKPIHEGRWWREGDSIVLQPYSGCGKTSFYGACQACSNPRVPEITEIWRLSYAAGFLLQKNQQLAIPVRCLLD